MLGQISPNMVRIQQRNSYDSECLCFNLQQKNTFCFFSSFLLAILLSYYFMPCGYYHNYMSYPLLIMLLCVWQGKISSITNHKKSQHVNYELYSSLVSQKRCPEEPQDTPHEQIIPFIQAQ